MEKILKTQPSKDKALVVGDIEVFEHGSFNSGEGEEDGWHFRTSLNVIDMLDFNDEASSFVIYAGTWELFEDVGYAGKSITRGPGRYGDIQAEGIANDSLSSFRQIA